MILRRRLGFDIEVSRCRNEVSLSFPAPFMKRLMERRRMGFGYFCSIFVLSLFFIHSFCQQPNTDEYFVSDFLHKMGFNLSVSVCSWKGVQCDVSEVYILGLNVSNMGLSGLIPDNSIGKLSKLQILDLSNNKITGLPSDFWSLGSLKILNLSSNQFSGYLPSNIGNFGHLQALDISNNNFSGNIPEAVSSLASLKILKLNQNGFESSIPSGLMSCPSLVSIDLSSNHLRGYLPKGFFSAFPNLEWLNIAVNGIRGQESDFLGMSSISYLNLSRNQFQVNLSYTFNWSNMVYLDLSENQFGGGILLTKFISEAKKLKQLNLAFTRLESRGFPKIMKSPGLEYLNLSGLNLTGQIPTEISKMKSLKILDLSFNNLSGEVPLKVLDKLLLMERFNFSYNNNLTLCDSEFSTEILQSVFIGSTNICPIAANPDSLRRKSSHHKWVTLALVVTVTLVICVLVVALLFLAFGYGCGCKRKKKNTWTVKKQESFKEETSISGPFSFQTDSMTWVADIKLATSVPVVIFEKPLLNFTFADLLSATSNFERGTLLAEGRFGPVYRGFLPGGTHVAVKVLVHGSTMTDQEAAREFEYLGRIKHPNLVPLMGYCLAGDQRIAIYDYMENGNLQNLLHDLPLGVLQTSEVWSRDIWDDDDDNDQNVGSERVLTNWRFRHKIALGTARALAFLHHGCSPPIIHREVKASSVYLDSSLEPRLSDFGLSKILGHVNENGNETESLTLKSDVYGFGVILFELISGKRAMEDDEEGSLVRWVRGLVKRNGGLIMAIDPKIQGTGPDEHMEEMLKIGYLCTADLPSKRPSMQQVVGLLKDIDPLKNHL